MWANFIQINWPLISIGLFAFFALGCLARNVYVKTCFFRHRRKRFLAMDLHEQVNAQGVKVPPCCCFSEHGKITRHHRFLMRWFCDACESMGEECWDQRGEWKLEQGQIVPDEKRWAQRL